MKIISSGISDKNKIIKNYEIKIELNLKNYKRKLEISKNQRLKIKCKNK